MGDKSDLLSSLLQDPQSQDLSLSDTSTSSAVDSLADSLTEPPGDFLPHQETGENALPPSETDESFTREMIEQIVEREEALQSELGEGNSSLAEDSGAAQLLETISSSNSFSLCLRNYQPKGDAVKALLQEYDLTPARPDAITQGDALYFTLLDEYRAIVLTQKLLALGLYPEVRDSELSPPVDQPFLTAGAPQVSLPQERVILSTTADLAEFVQEENLGLVSAHRSIPRQFFKQASASTLQEHLLKDRNMPPEGHFQQLVKELGQDLSHAALALGANAVLGIELDFFTETHFGDRASDELRVIMTGTAFCVKRKIDLPPNSL